jgi:hypothetical protein
MLGASYFLVDNHMLSDSYSLREGSKLAAEWSWGRGRVGGGDEFNERDELSLLVVITLVHAADTSLDNLIYHDVLSSFAYTRGPMVPYALILKHTQGQLSALHTLTGVNLPVFCKMYRVIKLIRQRRQSEGDGLLEVLGSAEQLEDELEAERQRVETLVRGTSPPHLS